MQGLGAAFRGGILIDEVYRREDDREEAYQNDQKDEGGGWQSFIAAYS